MKGKGYDKAYRIYKLLCNNSNLWNTYIINYRTPENMFLGVTINGNSFGIDAKNFHNYSDLLLFYKNSQIDKLKNHKNYWFRNENFINYLTEQNIPQENVDYFDLTDTDYCIVGGVTHYKPEYNKEGKLISHTPVYKYPILDNK